MSELLSLQAKGSTVAGPSSLSAGIVAEDLAVASVASLGFELPVLTPLGLH